MPTAHPAADHDRAAAFLANLPAPWTLGLVRAHRLAPELLDALDRTGWTLGPKLRAHLTANTDRVRSFPAVLESRIRDLVAPSSAPVPAAPALCFGCGTAASLVHGSGRCVRCATAPAGPPCPDPAARAAELRTALRSRRPAA